MTQLNFHNKNSFNVPPPPDAVPRLLPLLKKTKNFYLLWYNYYRILPKEHRYTLGQKIDALLVEIIEAIVIASFLRSEEKQPYVKVAIRKTDTLKIFLMILWETKSLNDKKYIFLSENLVEIGKMLGGWNGQLTKQNSLNKMREK
ncbi:four helix bundle protein [Patescibacteria group bacterium]